MLYSLAFSLIFICFIFVGSLAHYYYLCFKFSFFLILSLGLAWRLASLLGWPFSIWQFYFICFFSNNVSNVQEGWSLYFNTAPKPYVDPSVLMINFSRRFPGYLRICLGAIFLMQLKAFLTPTQFVIARFSFLVSAVMDVLFCKNTDKLMVIAHESWNDRNLFIF